MLEVYEYHKDVHLRVYRSPKGVILSWARAPVLNNSYLGSSILEFRAQAGNRPALPRLLRPAGEMLRLPPLVGCPSLLEARRSPTCTSFGASGLNMN